MNYDLLYDQQKGCLTCMAIALVMEPGDEFYCEKCNKKHTLVLEEDKCQTK